MKNIIKLFGITALVAVIAFSFAACGDDSGSGGGSGGGGGTFTLTGIPAEYNGKYATLLGGGNLLLLGAQTITDNARNGAPISDGSVKIPMWISTDDTIKRFSGNHSCAIQVSISNTPNVIGSNPAGPFSFFNVAFSNGSAAKTWGDMAD